MSAKTSKYNVPTSRSPAGRGGSYRMKALAYDLISNIIFLWPRFIATEHQSLIENSTGPRYATALPALLNARSRARPRFRAWSPDRRTKCTEITAIKYGCGHTSAPDKTMLVVIILVLTLLMLVLIICLNTYIHGGPHYLCATKYQAQLSTQPSENLRICIKLRQWSENHWTPNWLR